MAHPKDNLCYCVREMSYAMRGAAVTNLKRFDLVFYINGFPMVMCETKSPMRPSVGNERQVLRQVIETDLRPSDQFHLSDSSALSALLFVNGK